MNSESTAPAAGRLVPENAGPAAGSSATAIAPALFDKLHPLTQLGSAGKGTVSKVRLLVDTRTGAVVLTADGTPYSVEGLDESLGAWLS